MFRVLEESGEGVLGVELSSGYTKLDFEEFRKAFEAELASGHGRVSVLCKIDGLDLGKTSPAAFIDDSRYALGHMKQLRHIAVVGHSGLEKFLVRADNRILGNPGEDLVEKYFDVSDIDRAWEFVKS